MDKEDQISLIEEVAELRIEVKQLSKQVSDLKKANAQRKRIIQDARAFEKVAMKKLIAVAALREGE